MGARQTARAPTVRMQTPVKLKAKYISETGMRLAFSTASVPKENHKVVPMVLRALKTNAGLRAMPGWYVDRANKRRRR
jgi:hypothetical protein